MAMAPIGPTQPEAGVMAARPAMAPVAKPSTLGEILVTTTAMAAWPLAVRAAVPAVMCTTMPPAKSKTPIVLKKPASPQTIWVIGM